MMKKEDFVKRANELAEGVITQINADKVLFAQTEDKGAQKVIQSRMSRRGYDLEVLRCVFNAAEGKFDDCVKFLYRVAAFKVNNGRRDLNEFVGKKVWELEWFKASMLEGMKKEGFDISKEGVLVKKAS